MAIESSFSTLFQKLKLDDPWLSPKPWESIPSESGRASSSSISNTSFSNSSLYDLSSVSEASLVRLVMYALQGCQSSLISIEQISESFCSDPADRSANRIPSLWTRSLSTNALGKILKSVAATGSVVLLLHKFVEYFTSLNFDSINNEKREDKEQIFQNENNDNVTKEVHSARSLVNQAFAVAVGKVLQGYISAISTVNTSAFLRRSRSKDNVLPKISVELGNLTSVLHCELTLLEVYLHTEEMRTQIEALGNICCLHETSCCSSLSSLDGLFSNVAEVFSNFPRGGHLLTYLYNQLLVADSVHGALLKFLFHRSFEPYCSFIRSWIYEAKITDPYGEFAIEYEENLTSYSHGGMPVELSFPNIRVRDGISIPSFLKDFTIPLLRAGRQLKVVLKLLELCKYITTGEYTFEDFLPGCGGLQIHDVVNASMLTFNKKEIEDKVISKKKFYRMLLEKLEHVMKNFEIKYHQVTLHNALGPNINTGGSVDAQSSFTFDERLISSATGERDLDGTPQDEDSDTSSMADDLSYQLESSECTSEGQDDFMRSSELLEVASKPKLNHLSALYFSSIRTVDGCTEESLRKDKGLQVRHDLMLSKTSKVSRPQLDHSQNRILSSNDTGGDDPESSMEPSDTSEPWILKMKYVDECPGLGWPVGTLLKNPLDKWMHTDSGCQQHASSCAFDTLEDNGSSNGSANCLHDEMVAKTNSLSRSYILQSWNAKTPSNLLSMNPMLTRNNFQNHVLKVGNAETPKVSKIFPYFEFSSAEDSLKLQRRWFTSIPEDQSRIVSSVASTVQLEDGCLVDQYSQTDDTTNKKSVSHDSLNLEDVSKHSLPANLKDARGGSAWASLLHTRLRRINETSCNHGFTSDALFEIPLDFIISKCILQEILYQYNYISRLTIKLLEEGFALQEHLLTLCRYHFMETSDWADLFIRSLWHQKWCFTEADQRIAGIQGLLESSIQRSSCEQDLNKDRLYIYVKDSCLASLPSSATGVCSFNFIGLGYRVEWPISIILNPSALRTYAEIFSFLIQVKLAALSLTDLWCLVKDFGRIYSQPSKQHVMSCSRFNSLAKLRHQVHHFVSTLEQYVLSQLSDVSWCRFLYSLKHQVKDMIDLESVHMSYLSDSLRICFLADETKSTSNTIQGILQCALDFHSCLVQDNKADNKMDPSNLFQINNSQLLFIKRKFEESMKELHSQYLKSPKHGEFSLSRFWSCLNYNEYYSNTFNKEMPFYAVSL